MRNCEYAVLYSPAYWLQQSAIGIRSLFIISEFKMQQYKQQNSGAHNTMCILYMDTIKRVCVASYIAPIKIKIMHLISTVSVHDII